MTGPGRGESDPDELRRRLYRAGATPEDLHRYLDRRDDPDAITEPAPPPGRRRRRRRRPGLLALAVLAALLVAVLATGALLHRSPARPVAISESAGPAVVRLGTGDGEPAVRPGGVVGPLPTAIRLDGAAVAAERFEGVGDASLSVHLPSAEFGTLRATVLVFSSRTSTISWTALRRPGDDAVAARARVVGRVDVATPTAFTYAGGPPTRFAIAAPDGLRWTVLVAPTNGTGGDLR